MLDNTMFSSTILHHSQLTHPLISLATLALRHLFWKEGAEQSTSDPRKGGNRHRQRHADTAQAGQCIVQSKTPPHALTGNPIKNSIFNSISIIRHSPVVPVLGGASRRPFSARKGAQRKSLFVIILHAATQIVIAQSHT